MPKHEEQTTKEAQNTNDEDAASRSATSFSHSFELRHSDFVISLDHVPRKLSGLAKAERIGYKHPAPFGAEHDSARRQCRRHHWKSATRLAHLRYRTGRKSACQFAKNPRSTRGRFRSARAFPRCS